jgi:hypothetical protein
MVTKPPILTQVSVPGTCANPAPKALQDFLRSAGGDFVKPDGCDNFGLELGSTNVCAIAPELNTTADAIATATTHAGNTVQRAIR